MSNFWRGKKVLITGAEGFIGSHLTEKLIRQGAELRAFILYNAFDRWGWLDTMPKKLLKKIDIFRGDIRDPHRVREALMGRDIVFHLASLTGTPYSYHAPDSYIDTNVKGVLNILNASRLARVERVIYTSTSAVYGTSIYVPVDEKHPLQPESLYSASKAAAESIAISYHCSFKLPVTILRPFNAFGPRQSARAVVPTIISQVYSGCKLIKLGNLTVKMDLSYVEDTVNAFMKVAETKKANGEVFNCGSGQDISIKDLTKLIMGITGRKIKIISDKERIRYQRARRFYSDSGKITRVCGWKQTISLIKGLEITCKWVKDNISKFKPSLYNV